MLKFVKGLHRHHVIPKHQGGTDDDSNIVYLTREEHIKAHQDLYEKYGHDGDRKAVLILTYGYSKGCEIISSENCRKGALISHEIKLKNGFYEKLGQLNSKRIQGTSNDAHAEFMKTFHKENPQLWWNNGTTNKRSPICPGEDWIRGRLNK